VLLIGQFSFVWRVAPIALSGCRQKDRGDFVDSLHKSVLLFRE
jgi:hypothetical protein